MVEKNAETPSPDITPEEIAEGLRKCEEMTKGPWIVDLGTWALDSEGSICQRTDDGCPDVIDCQLSEGRESVAQFRANLDGIAHARTLLPRTLRALQDANQRNERWETVLMYIIGHTRDPWTANYVFTRLRDLGVEVPIGILRDAKINGLAQKGGEA